MRSGAGHNSGLDVAEARALEGGCQHAVCPEAEWPRLAGRGGRQLCPAADDRDRDGEKVVSLGGRVDDRRSPPARLERAEHSHQRLLLVGKVDQPDARDTAAYKPSSTSISSPSIVFVAMLARPAALA